MRWALQNTPSLNRPHIKFTLSLHKPTSRICHRLDDVEYWGVDVKAPSAGRFF